MGAFDYGGKNIAGWGSLSQEEKRDNFFKPTSLRPNFFPSKKEVLKYSKNVVPRTS
jgi:hypothetical protein